MTNGNASDGIRRHRIVFFLNAVRNMLTIILFAANRRLCSDFARVKANHRNRGIEWSLQAFSNMRAVRLFYKYEQWSIFPCEQRALRKFSTSCNLSLLKLCFAPSNLVDTLKTGQTAHSWATWRPYRGSTISSSLQPIMLCLIWRLRQNYSASQESVGGR